MPCTRDRRLFAHGGKAQTGPSAGTPNTVQSSMILRRIAAADEEACRTGDPPVLQPLQSVPAATGNGNSSHALSVGSNQGAKLRALGGSPVLLYTHVSYGMVNDYLLFFVSVSGAK